MIITLDGPSGVGKTTMARQVAEALHLPYLDTGAMFRYLGLILGEGGVAMSDDELVEKTKGVHFSLSGVGMNTRILANNIPIGEEIRTEAVGKLASNLAKRVAFRQILLERQRQLGQEGSLVVEGRDMGTVVFPTAQFKFFLDASPETRAARRWKELKARGSEESVEEIAEALKIRDEQDRNRAVAPLKPAKDAIIIDTSSLTREEVLELVLAPVRQTVGL